MISEIFNNHNFTSEDGKLLFDIYQQQYSEFWSIAWKYVQQMETADDLVQDAFLKCIETWDTIRSHDPRSLESYLSMTIRNMAINQANYRKRHMTVEYVDECYHNFETPENIYFDSVEIETVRRCLEKLPQSYQTYLKLRYIENKAIDEIGKILGIGGSNLRMLGKRSIDRLRVLVLEAELEDE